MNGISRMLPEYCETVVVGGGTAGATCAGLLAELGSDPVLLLEAGPDYGPRNSERWPKDLLDARYIPLSHDWRLSSWPERRHASLDHPRARVIGGCSAHNGCTAAPGPAFDYDAWAAAGAPGWAGDEVRPLLELMLERMRVHTFADDELTPAHQAFVQAGQDCGLPYAADLDTMDARIGIGPMPVNVVEGVRWNSAFAFLDHVRGHPGLTIVGEATTQRIILNHGRARGVEVLLADGVHKVHADRVIVCAGAYGSPALLLRSGIGCPAHLAARGVRPAIELPSVGANLLDHPCVAMHFAGSEEFSASKGALAWSPDEQTIGRSRSSWCDGGPYDIHVFMVAGENSGHPGLPPISIYGSAVRARSAGTVGIVDGNPASPPELDHRYLSDSEGHDIAVLSEARQLLHEMVASPSLARLLGRPVGPQDEDIRRHISSYCHPAGTCKMGSVNDPTAVTGFDGGVHGVAGLYVADACLMPTITRANPNVPTGMIAAHVVAQMLDLSPSRLAALASHRSSETLVSERDPSTES